MVQWKKAPCRPDRAEGGKPRGDFAMAIENSVIFLPCRDIAATHDFYTRVVGLQKVQEQAGGTLHIYDTGYGYWGFCQYPDDRPVLGGPQGVCLSLNCADEADVDRFYARVTEQGARVLAAPAMQERFPVYSFFIEDPSGYKVEFQKILLPDQELTGGRK